MIVVMTENSRHFIGAVADFFSSDVGLVFAGLIVLVFIAGVVKSLIS